jgi:SAM-dependent methyltransferase
VPLPYAELFERFGLGINHLFLVEAVPQGARVLDVGCASGYVAQALAERRGATTVGIEPDPAMAKTAEQFCERVYPLTIEAAQQEPDLNGDRFDAILFGDVLEHLVDPWGALVWARGLLAPGGRVIVSIPNVGHWSVRWSLLRGRFDYTDHGLLDRTHLRFFTHKTARELAERAGFVVESERFTPAPLPGEVTLQRLRSRPAPAAHGGSEAPDAADTPRAAGPAKPRRLPEAFSRTTLARLYPELLAQQFVMTLRPAQP